MKSRCAAALPLGTRWLLLICVLLAIGAGAAEVIPPAPKRYFNDYANVVPTETANRLNSVLEDFERKTSSQIVVAVYDRMESASSIEDYTVRVAQAWRVGGKQKDNGAVLFVFIKDRAMFLQVGYGLEGAVPDATAHQIIENEIKPYFRNGDYGAGLTAGVQAILQAAQGEYKGTGKTVDESRQGKREKFAAYLPLIIIVVIFLLSMRRRGGRLYRRGGYDSWTGGGWGGGWGGGGWGGGGWGGGGGGGFSGGGGGFGGGGAGGRW